jgi:hypothetical protein
MGEPREVFLSTLPYPRRDGVNPSSWDEILVALENHPTRSGTFKTKDVLGIFKEFPGAPLWVDFIRTSWRVWDDVAAGRDILRNAVQTATEWELSERRLTELLRLCSGRTSRTEPPLPAAAASFAADFLRFHLG